MTMKQSFDAAAQIDASTAAPLHERIREMVELEKLPIPCTEPYSQTAPGMSMSVLFNSVLLDEHLQPHAEKKP